MERERERERERESKRGGREGGREKELKISSQRKKIHKLTKVGPNDCHQSFFDLTGCFFLRGQRFICQEKDRKENKKPNLGCFTGDN